MTTILNFHTITFFYRIIFIKNNGLIMFFNIDKQNII